MSGFFIVMLIVIVLMATGVALARTGRSGDDLQSGEEPENDSNVEDLEEPNAIIEAGERHESNQDWNRALKAWSKLIQVSPERTDAYFRRAIAAYRTENYQQAREDFDHVIHEAEDPPPETYLHAARSLVELEQQNQAFPYYTEYVESGSPSTNELMEAAELAQSLEQWSDARSYFERVVENEGDLKLVTEAELQLLEIALEQEQLERAENYMDSMETKYDEENLTDDQELNYWYLKAKFLTSHDKNDEAERYYRQIYQRDPSFRDVKGVVEQQISALDADSLIRKFRDLDQNSFEDLCSRVIEGMGFEIISSEFMNPEELDVVARESSMSLRVTRALFAFKQWNETAGELAIKEFEFKLIENRYEQGYFSNPSGYNSAAQRYARGNEKLTLLGAEQLLSYLEDWYQEKPEDS